MTPTVIPAVIPATTLILGGARSGKSALAEQRCLASGLERHYLATAQIWDAEMAARIAAHQQRRDGWTTHEVPLDLTARLQALAAPQRVLLVDCLTLWLTNLLLAEAGDDATVQRACDGLLAVLPLPGPVLFVSNEVGLGIVPDNALARRFRDFAGRLHQRLAERADVVLFVAAGLPLTLKEPAHG